MTYERGFLLRLYGSRLESNSAYAGMKKISSNFSRTNKWQLPNPRDKYKPRHGGACLESRIAGLSDQEVRAMLQFLGLTDRHADDG